MSAKIVLVTNSKYLNICNTFIKLKNKNWVNCPYKTVVSYCGEKESLWDYNNVLYNGLKASLPTCIYNAVLNEEDDYAICFLGDAFIYKLVDNELIQGLVEYVEKEKIDYLRLLPSKYNEEKMAMDNFLIRKLSHKDRGITFVAFIASKKFIENEFSNGITDYEFEVNFLSLSYCKSKPVEWRKYKIYTVIDNIMNLKPGIDKGRWDREAYQIIKKYNKEVFLPELPKVPFTTHIIRKIVYRLLLWIPTKYTRNIKWFITKLHIYRFASKE